MAKLPVTELVCKNSDNLLRFALLDQGIVDDNVLLPRQSKEVGIAVRTALAAINDEQFVERELQLFRKRFSLGLQLAFLQGRQLVEQRQDEDRIDRDHENLENSSEEPEVGDELVACLLDDAEETGEDRRRKGESEQVRLDHIRDEELWSLFVEPEFLFQDERMVDIGGQRQGLLDQDEREDEDDRV